jgi:UDP-glucose 4-epimerase
MKILVTGGVGFIGSNLVKRLLKENYEVHSLDNYSTGTANNEHEGAVYHTGNIVNVGLMDRDFDIIFHLAALSRVQPSFTNPSETFDVNVTGTKEVLELARHCNAKVVYAGSSSKHYNPYQSPYAGTKYMGEELVKIYRTTYGIKAEIARFYNVYGPGEILDGNMAAVIGKFRHAVNSKLPLIVVGDGEQRRDFTHVDDIVDGLFRIGFKREEHEDAWELGTGVNYSINEVVKMFNEHAINRRDQLGNYRETLRINSDAKDRLNWKPQDRLKQYIESL